ncbi:hypothetical protein Tco_0221264 [Tanacetum coccineum]
MADNVAELVGKSRGIPSSLLTVLRTDPSALGVSYTARLMFLGQGRDEKKRLDHLKQDQEMLVIKIFSERKKVFKKRKKCEKIRSKRGKKKGLVTHDFEGHEFEKTCNNDKSLSEIQIEHEKENEFIMVVVKVTLRGSGSESFWEGGDDFGVNVLHFHTCLTDILGFLEKLEWWFEQDIDDGEEEDEEGEGGSEV